MTVAGARGARRASLRRAGVLACVSLAALWYATRTWITTWRPGGSWSIAAYDGDVVVFLGDTSLLRGLDLQHHEPYPGLMFHAPHFTCESPFCWEASVPIWGLELVAVLLTVHVWLPPRHVPGHCSRCGYDLAGLSSGLCPECGLGLGRSELG
jgi:hypothetical protein